MRGRARRVAGVGALVLIAVCSTPWSAGRASGSQREPAPGPERVVDTGELMDLFLLPAYQELQRATARPPVTRADWAAIYRTSVRLAEMEHLLFFREPNRYTTNPRFPTLAAQARQATVDVVNATLAGMVRAGPGDYEPVRRAYVAVSRSCNACHRGLSTMNGATIKP